MFARYDAANGTEDSWIFYGDSITAGAMNLDTQGSAKIRAFNQLINERFPNYYPIAEGGGIGYLLSGDGLKYIDQWLTIFPGKYVGLSYGTNDALNCLSAATVKNNYIGMIKAVLAGGKVPVVPHVPWGSSQNIQNCAPALNAAIDELYTEYNGQLLKGPDLWAFFNSNQNLISSDGIHPNTDGMASYRQQWASAMLMQVYYD